METLSVGKWLFSHRITSVSGEAASTVRTLLNTTSFYLFGQHRGSGLLAAPSSQIDLAAAKIRFQGESFHIMAFQLLWERVTMHL